MTSETKEGLHLRLVVMDELIAELEQTIVDQGTKDFLLKLPKNWLGDAHGFIASRQLELAGLALTLVEQTLVGVKKSVSTYGPNIRIY